MTVGKICTYSDYVCALCQPEHTCGGFDRPTYVCETIVGTSLGWKVCATTRQAEVSSWSPLCASFVQAAMWECGWQCCGNVSGIRLVSDLRQGVSEKRGHAPVKGQGSPLKGRGEMLWVCMCSSTEQW